MGVSLPLKEGPVAFSILHLNRFDSVDLSAVHIHLLQVVKQEQASHICFAKHNIQHESSHSTNLDIMDFLQKRMKRVSGMFSGPKTDFQVLSDLNLDYESQYLTFHIPVAAPYLILAGNIGRLADYDDYLSFLVRRCNLHEKVYLVLGALEFHGITWMEGLQ